MDKRYKEFFANTLRPSDDDHHTVLNSIIYLETAPHKLSRAPSCGDLSQFILRCLTLCSSYFFLAFIPFKSMINSFLSAPATHCASCNWQKGGILAAQTESPRD